MFGMPRRARLLVWNVAQTAGFDAAWVEVDDTRLRASGQLVGQNPVAYSARYELETENDFVTRRITVESGSERGRARLELVRDQGEWSVNGRLRPDLAGALDCDLAGCPLTNTMPILRHAFHRERGSHVFTVAFIQLPGLDVVAASQAYEYLRPLAGGDVLIRYRSGSFESDLTIDRDGFVVDYPKLGARRVEPDRESAA